MMDTNSQQSRTIQTCTNCKTSIPKSLYRDNSGWLCSHCLPPSRACTNLGCTHTDTDKKCEKHEWFFCTQSTRCRICSKTLPRRSLFTHYDTAHEDIRHAAGSTWRATAGVHDFLVPSDAGTAMCHYGLDQQMFAMYVSIPVEGERLSEFQCEVTVRDPDTGYQRTVAPNVEYIYLNDWRIIVHKHECPSWNTSFDVRVEISKLDS